MSDESPSVEQIQSIVDDSPFLSSLGIECESVEVGRTVLTMPFREHFENTFGGSAGSIHGGALATLIDAGCGLTIRSTFGEPVEAKIATTDLSVSYVRPANADVRLEAEIVRAGGSMGFAEASVAGTHSGSVVANGHASFRIFRVD